MKTCRSGYLEAVTLFFFVQTMGENAPSQLILYHYPELKEDKGVVLMTAEMDPKFIVSPLPVWSHLDVAVLIISHDFWMLNRLSLPLTHRPSTRLSAWPIRCSCSTARRGRRRTDWSRHLTTTLQSSNTCQ